MYLEIFKKAFYEYITHPTLIFTYSILFVSYALFFYTKGVFISSTVIIPELGLGFFLSLAVFIATITFLLSLTVYVNYIEIFEAKPSYEEFSIIFTKNLVFVFLFYLIYFLFSFSIPLQLIFSFLYLFLFFFYPQTVVFDGVSSVVAFIKSMQFSLKHWRFILTIFLLMFLSVFFLVFLESLFLEYSPISSIILMLVPVFFMIPLLEFLKSYLYALKFSIVSSKLFLEK